jgi:AcrR family transcriptional regulator
MKRDKQILQAACKLFVERGFEPVSIDEIGRAVGVSGPAIYRHFSSKAEILSVICHQTVDRLVELAGPPRDDPREELDALVAGQVKLVMKHPELVIVYENEERFLPDNLRRPVRRRQKEHAERWISALVRLRPRESRADLEITAFATIGLLLSVPRWPRSIRQHPSLEEHLKAIALNNTEAMGFASVS